MSSPHRQTILFLGADAGYLYRFRGPLMQLFQKRGYHVVAAAAVTDDFDPAFFTDIDVMFRLWPLQKASLDPLADLGPLLALWRIMREVRPDIVFAHTVKAVIYGLAMARLASVARRTAMIPGLGYAFSDSGGLKRYFVRGLATAGYRLALSGAHKVIFQNEDDLRTLLVSGAMPSGTPTGVVNGSGVDMAHHAPAPWPSGPPKFLMVARLLSEKGVYDYVEAARIVRREMPETRFVLVGTGDANPSAISQAEVEAWVAEGLIEARGHLPDPRQEYAACHAFVLPSYYREGCPRVNLEAMATGRAVITTDWVGCRETVIDGVNGILIPVRDPHSLARAMLKLAHNLEMARNMGQAGRRLCAVRFELSLVTENTAEMIIT